MESNDPTVRPNKDSKRILYRRNKIFVGLLIAFVGLSLFTFGYYFRTGHATLADILLKIGQFLVLIVSLHFMYEWFVKDFDREEYIDALASLLKPQSDKLDELVGHTRSVLDLVYSDSTTVEAKWKSMVDRFETFMLIGDVPVPYLHAIPMGGAKQKSIAIYRTVTERNRSDIVGFLKMFSGDDYANCKVYHIGRFDWGFTLVASTKQGSEVEILLNYATSPEEGPTGYHVLGNTAIAILNSLKGRLSAATDEVYPDESDSALPIEGEDMVRELLSQRIRYKSFLHELRQGIPLKGEEAICNRMSSILSRTNSTLDVTHIAKRGSINLLDGPIFKDWLAENYRAAEKGVKIRRIFLVDRNELTNEVLLHCVNALESHNIEVKYCILGEVADELVEDFSIYDGADLVFISPAAGGAWKEERTEARHSCDPTRIQRYRVVFDQLYKDARGFTRSS